MGAGCGWRWRRSDPVVIVKRVGEAFFFAIPGADESISCNVQYFSERDLVIGC
jgi:hypothetical protein